MAEDTICVRTATNADREAVWQLILDSFLAIVDSTHESFRPRYDEAGRAAREADLKDIEASYLRSADSHFWVAESSQHGVVGCVALQRSAPDEAKLIRMAVNPDMRGKGVGEKLISTLYRFARAQGYLRIVLVTINKRAANFYKKMGFVSYIERPMDMPPAVNVVLFSMVTYLAEKFITNVAVTGGTHGNERLGVMLVDEWTRDPTTVTRSTFTTQVLLTNPAATKKNVRYVDVDMNRCFTFAALQSKESNTELDRARELERLLGPKTETGFDPRCDFIIDLHSSTANMGLSVIVLPDSDAFGRRVTHAMCAAGDVKVTGKQLPRADSYALESVSPSGIAIEVGPLAHGTLKYELLAGTARMVRDALDAIEAHNLRLQALVDQNLAVKVVDRGRTLAVPVDIAEGKSNTSPLLVPPAFPQLDLFEMAMTLDYPRHADGTISALIAPQLEGRDWSQIDPDVLFVDSKGAPVAVPRPTPPAAPHAGPPPPDSPLYAIFINEAAYYEKGVAMALCKKLPKHVY